MSKWLAIPLFIVIAILLLLAWISILQPFQPIEIDDRPIQEAALPPAPTATSSFIAPTRLPTITPRPTYTRTPRPRNTHTPTPTPRATPTPAYVVNTNSNVRSGPSTDFSIVGGRQQGQVVNPLARTEDGSWVQIGTGQWIYSQLITGNIGSIIITYDLPALPSPTTTPIPTSVPQPTPVEYFHPFCLTDEFVQYTEQMMDIDNDKELLLQQFFEQTEAGKMQESRRTLQQFEHVFTDALSLSPPAELLDTYQYFMNSILWFANAGNAFEMAYEWGQPHWIDTAIERLKKSDEFTSLADKSIGVLCFE